MRKIENRKQLRWHKENLGKSHQIYDKAEFEKIIVKQVSIPRNDRQNVDSKYGDRRIVNFPTHKTQPTM